MSKMVSARVPDALFAQASMQLHEMGATTSDLVNAAFEYVLREKALPCARDNNTSHRALRKRTLTPAQKNALVTFFDKCTIDVAISDDIAQDKRAAREARIAKYEDIT